MKHEKILVLLSEVEDLPPQTSWPSWARHPNPTHYKREKSFAGGRLCARAALQRMNCPSFLIENLEKPFPGWPEGYLGSISHCQAGFGVALAKSDQVLLGFDRESRFLSPLDGEQGRNQKNATCNKWQRPLDGEQGRNLNFSPEHLMKRIASSSEKLNPFLFQSIAPTHFTPQDNKLTEVANLHETQKALFLFSAKEALYKAQFPRWELKLGFKDVEIKSPPEILYQLPKEFIVEEFDFRFEYKAVKDITEFWKFEMGLSEEGIARVAIHGAHYLPKFSFTGWTWFSTHSVYSLVVGKEG